MSMNSTKFRHALLGASAMISAAAVASAAYAADARQYDFDMPAQPLTLALKTFGATADQQLIFSERLVNGRTAPALKGAYTPDQALAMLLTGSGLTADKTPGGVVTIRSASDPQSGSAAGDGADSGTVQALIVTAQKREENIQDVPIAMSAFTQEDLTRSQVAGGPDLMTQVPNMTFTKTNFSSYSIQIRGIGTQAISATTDAAVAVAFNNTPFIRNRFFEQEFYDLERVEVLRGPQGTLYGRNATAGVVNIISAKPKFTYEAKLSADVANYNSTRLEGMINLPLVDDKVALRIAGAWTKREGFVTNEITGNPIDGRDLWSTRVSLRFTPTDKLNANLIWEHFEEDDDRLRSGKQLCHKDIVTEIGGIPVAYNGGGFGGAQANFSQGCAPASLYSPDSFETPNGWALPYYHPLGALSLPTITTLDPYISATQSRDLRVIESTVDPHYSAETDVVELQFNFDLTNDLTLTSETGYLSDTLFSTQDYNRFNTAPGAFGYGLSGGGQPLRRENVVDTNGYFCDPQVGCANRLVAVDLSTADSHHFSQEFRLASNYDAPFNFSVGANFLRYDTEDKYYVFINSLTLQAVLDAALFNSNINWTPYQQGVSDNTECLPRGYVEPDPFGAYDVTGCVYIDPNPIGNLNDQGHNYFLSRNPYKLISYAVFGEAYYNVTDALKITAGVRWTVDKKEAPRIPSWVLGQGVVGYPVAEVIDQEWHEPTGRLTIDWKPNFSFTDETLLYASAARGYKAGGANPPRNGLVMYCIACSGSDIVNRYNAASATQPKTFDPEFVNAFEVGAKNTLLDNRLTFNTAAFYYDYTGYQISQIVNRAAINMNFDAKVWGVEIEADWRPIENLRLGFKGGYENTRVADGERAVDVMDRTAGHTDWVVVKPFPTFPSNCILPLSSVVYGGQVHVPGNISGGVIGGCELAYVFGFDPRTGAPYPDNPPPGYVGYDPTVDVGQNNGEGFYKDLSGNKLPNAPKFTTTITADYTLPLPSNWLMTLHTDLYYQSEAWTRIFNTPGYDKLKAYTNVNLAAIFSNEDAGWKIIAYVKNVFDRDSITGAFLNSDDSGLTTNVFLTEPRLYGLRVTKAWSGGPWWTGANPSSIGPFPLTVEIGGQVQRHDAPYEPLAPAFTQAFSDALNPTAAQNRDLDWGDGREVRLTWRPTGSSWTLAGGFRSGRANTDTARIRAEEVAGPQVCIFDRNSPAPFGKLFCDPTYYGGVYYEPLALATPKNWMDATARSREDHTVIDFGVGKDVGLGSLGKSTLTASLRYAKLKSTTSTTMDGIPNWDVPEGFYKYAATRNRYTASIDAERSFKGAGPTLSWTSAAKLWGAEDAGALNLDWALTGGVLFGRQTTAINGQERSEYFRGGYEIGLIFGPPNVTEETGPVPIRQRRSKSVNVPVLDLSLGLSYEVGRIKAGAGYRWERYFNALDVGYLEHKNGDRTMDGPYFKIAFGFGG